MQEKELILWKNYHQKYFNLKPPTFGLNFLEDKDRKNKKVDLRPTLKSQIQLAF